VNAHEDSANNYTIIQKAYENEFKNTIDDAIEIDFDYNAMVVFQIFQKTNHRPQKFQMKNKTQILIYM
jgi:hypothetical protein